MDFERSDRFDTEEKWDKVNHETLLRECTDEQITMMILYKATVRTTRYLYRRHIPAIITDWAKELPNGSPA